MPRAPAKSVRQAEVWSSVSERVVCGCCNGRRQRPGRECHLLRFGSLTARPATYVASRRCVCPCVAPLSALTLRNC